MLHRYVLGISEQFLKQSRVEISPKNQLNFVALLDSGKTFAGNCMYDLQKPDHRRMFEFMRENYRDFVHQGVDRLRIIRRGGKDLNKEQWPGWKYGPESLSQIS